MLSILGRRNPEEIGERLRAARSKAGLTQEQVSQELQIARTTLLAIEKGQRRVRPDEFRRLADLYRVSVNTLLRHAAVHVDLVPRFRALAGTDESSKIEAAQLLNNLAAAEVELEQRLGQPLKTNYPPEYTIQSGDIRLQAEDVAMETRHRFGIGQSPVVDVLTLLELEVGMRVFVRPLKSSISGLFIYDDRLGACMLLNEKHPRTRRALTALHEFGHFISVRTAPDVVDLTVSPQSREDRFANLFAVSFMMPAAVVRRKFHEMRQDSGRFSPRHLILLSHYFNVSIEAMCRRLEGIDLLPGGTWDSLKDRGGFPGETVRRELGDRAKEREEAIPPRLWLLAAEAFRRELFDEGQIAQMLSMGRVEVRGMLDDLEVGGNDDLQSAS